MEATIEKRVTDLEALIIDLPEIMNFLFERVETALRDHAARFDEMGGRLNLLDKQMGMVLRDVRDMRGGVTRQLMAQDGEIAAIKDDVSVLKADVAELKADVLGLKTDVSVLKTDVKSINGKLDVLLARGA